MTSNAVALTARDWIAVAELAGFGALCAGAAWTARDPENPRGVHQSFRPTSLRDDLADSKAKGVERAE